MKFNKVAILLAVLVLLLSVLACGSSAPAGVSNVYMSTDKAGMNKTTTFAPADTIYVSFDVNQVDKGASFDIKWYALNVSGQDPNTPFLTSNYIYSSESSLSAHINSTTGGFPVGQYKVEIDMNGTKAAEQQFDIK